MNDHDDGGVQLRSLQAAFRHTGMSLEELWLDYFALGGTIGLVEVEAFLAELMPLANLERDLLAQAVNERLDDLTGRVRASYSFSLRDEVPQAGPLAAVLHLVTGMQLAPPERLSAVTRTAGKALGVDLRVLLVDYEQEALHPLADADEDAEVQVVDTTLAGQCFRSARPLAHGTELWVPLVDGVEGWG